jgi:hypothetical protein
VKTNASIPQHCKQVKEYAANAEVSKARHAANCETGQRRDDAEQEHDRHSRDCL